MEQSWRMGKEPKLCEKEGQRISGRRNIRSKGLRQVRVCLLKDLREAPRGWSAIGMGQRGRDMCERQVGRKVRT